MLEAIRNAALGAWDFIVGDDWLTALGVVVGLAAAAAIATTTVAAWWVMPLLVACLLALSVLRVARGAVRRR
ncbi:MAG: hypothetical protein ACYCU0_05075 [Solirubrobacteraceae bacterium]